MSSAILKKKMNSTAHFFVYSQNGKYLNEKKPWKIWIFRGRVWTKFMVIILESNIGILYLPQLFCFRVGETLIWRPLMKWGRGYLFWRPLKIEKVGGRGTFFLAAIDEWRKKIKFVYAIVYGRNGYRQGDVREHFFFHAEWPEGTDFCNGTWKAQSTGPRNV